MQNKDDQLKYLRDLEAENAALRSQLASNTPAGASMVRTVASPVIAPADFPDAQERLSLLRIVFHTHPRLKPNFWTVTSASASLSHDEAFILAQFEKAFRWQRTMGRGGLHPTRLLGYATDACREWLEIHHQDRVPPGESIVLAALIAAGDVEFMDPVKYFPNLMRIGLTYRASEGGRAADLTTWRRVLGSARAPQGMDPGESRFASPRPQITEGGRPITPQRVELW